MIETIRGLCRLLATEPLTLEQIAADLGTVHRVLGQGEQLLVKPSDPAFKIAHIIGLSSDHHPSQVRLELAEPSQGILEVLRDAFGEHGPPVTLHYDADPTISFDADLLRDQPWQCSVIATVRAGPTGVDHGSVLAVSVRRDRRYD